MARFELCQHPLSSTQRSSIVQETGSNQYRPAPSLQTQAAQSLKQLRTIRKGPDMQPAQDILLGRVNQHVQIHPSPKLRRPDTAVRDGFDEDDDPGYPLELYEDVQSMINEPSDEQNPEPFTDKVDLGESSFAVSTLCRLIVTTAWSQDRPISDFDFGFPDQIKRDNTNNTFFAERYSAPPKLTASMDGDRELAQLPDTFPASARVKPLQPRKVSSQTHVALSQPESNNHNFRENIPAEKPTFPPRTSSIRSHPTYRDLATSQPHAMRTKTPSRQVNSAESSFAANSLSHHHNKPSSDPHSTTRSNTGHRIVLDLPHYFSDTSSAIMGDFVPIDSPDMAGLTPDIDPTDDRLRGTFKAFRDLKANPYEFEPSTPYSDPSRQTTFTDFIKQGQEAPSSLPTRAPHVKNARSESNAMPMAQNQTHLVATPAKPTGRSLYRSESSPNVAQVPNFPLHNATPSSDILKYYLEAGKNVSPVGRGRQGSQDSTPRGGRNVGAMYDSQFPPRHHPNCAQELASRSPTCHAQQVSLSKGTVNRNMIRDQSPSKALDDVSERGEYHDSQQNRSSNTSSNITDSYSPKKRSRSPMKKMFGENGWLGKSPDEKPVLNMRPKKKVGMMEKIKNKFEEMAEKADLSPIGRPPSNSDKNKQSVLAVSITPPEQARVYMEIELMLVHTASSFLMNQFSQGRMNIDTVKKTIETWKNKGRPTVIEFMYDQATQRELVLANQKNFRFHGENAGSDIRLNSMLYNWKQVANLMLIRTFCNADQVILKLLFDIEQILELLGAVEPMMVRLHQIRATVSEMIRLARLSKVSKVSSQPSLKGREPPCNSTTAATSTLHNMDDPYGGMKLVPNDYME